MSERIWRFEGQLQERDKRVVTEAEGFITEINEGETPEIDVSSRDGLLTIDLKLPTRKVLDALGVGKQYLVNGSATNIQGQKYGEVFNDVDGNNAVGIYSHAAGYHTKAGYPYQTVFGKYNKNNKNNIFEIGFGESDANRVNIFELDKEGNLTVIGDVGNTEGISLSSLNKDKVDFTELASSLWQSQPKLMVYTNKDMIEAAAGVETQIGFFEFATVSETNPLYWATIPFTLGAESKVTVKYYIDDVLQSDDTVVEKYNAGTHYITLFDYFTMPDDYVGELKVTITAAAANLEISSYAIKSCLYIQGVGITGLWTGSLKLKDTVSTFDLSKLSIAKFNEEVSVTTHIPIPANLTDTVGTISLKKISVAGITDSVSISPRIENYIFSTDSANDYEYNTEIISIKNGYFVVNNEYIYSNYVEETIDENTLIQTFEINDLNTYTNINSLEILL